MAHSDESYRYPIIPRPTKLTARDGAFTFQMDSAVYVKPEELDQLKSTVELLKAAVAETGSPVATVTALPTVPHVELAIDESVGSSESYRLDVSPERIQVIGADAAGVFYGTQTLLQLLKTSDEGQNSVPAVAIEDAPRFRYRGLMLDVGRHFRSAEFVKRLLDEMARYKLNRFHWHLTEDQGWRIEIKKYPKLTEIGAWRPETLVGHAREVPQKFDGKRHGGFYTQEQIRDVVEHAARLHITIVPEIELPGHSRAALAAYPELACTKGPFTVAKTWGIFEDVYCPKERTFQFLEDVLSEVVELFPSKYIHIGGDEVPKVRWKESADAQALMKREKLKDEEALQSYFISRIVRFLESKGRHVIGWDEILEGGLPKGTTVMSWRGINGGVEAAKLGHDVIMTPNTHLYFDYYQHQDTEREPLAIGGYLPVEQVYAYEPIPEELDEKQAAHVLGAQANVWTEYMKTPEQVQYMIFPRLLALSEVTWSTKERRNWGDFAGRLPEHLALLDEAKIRYARHFYLIKHEPKARPDGTLELGLESFAGHDIVYTLDGSAPTPTSTRYTEPLLLTKSVTVTAVGLLGGKLASDPIDESYVVHLATGKPVTYGEPYSEKYPSREKLALTSGLRGTKNFRDGRWQGFDGKDLVATVDLGEARVLGRIEVGFLQDIGTWIFLPKSVEYLVSTDGKTFDSVKTLESKQANAESPLSIEKYEIKLDAVSARYVRVVAKNHGNLPEWHAGKGTPAWLFVDQIVVE